MIIHGRVVDDLVRDPETLAGVVLAGLVGHRHSPFNTPTKAECFRQPDVEPAVFQSVAVVPDHADQTTLVGLLKAFSYFLGAPEASPVVTLGMVEGTLKGVGVHGGRWSGTTLCGLTRCFSQ